MHRSEGVNVAVAAILLGIGAVILGLLAPIAAAAVGAACAAGGIYLLLGVYVGGRWFWLPTTATARAFRPRLKVVDRRVRKITPSYVVIQFNVKNEGRDNVSDALVNFVVPDFVEDVERCTPEGDTNIAEDRGGFWREDERFWSGNVTFTGRDNRLMFFRIEPRPTATFSARLKVSSPVLDERFEYRFEVIVGEGTIGTVAR